MHVSNDGMVVCGSRCSSPAHRLHALGQSDEATLDAPHPLQVVRGDSARQTVECWVSGSFQVTGQAVEVGRDGVQTHFQGLKLKGHVERGQCLQLGHRAVLMSHIVKRGKKRVVGVKNCHSWRGK